MSLDRGRTVRDLRLDLLPRSIRMVDPLERDHQGKQCKRGRDLRRATAVPEEKGKETVKRVLD